MTKLEYRDRHKGLKAAIIRRAAGCCIPAGEGCIYAMPSDGSAQARAGSQQAVITYSGPHDQEDLVKCWLYSRRSKARFEPLKKYFSPMILLAKTWITPTFREDRCAVRCTEREFPPMKFTDDGK